MLFFKNIFKVKAIVPVPNDKIPLIATIGRKYRSLLSRYIKDNNNSGSSTTNNELEGDSMQSNSSLSIDDSVHCILWKAENWV